jgi:Zn-dependent peptidase ImmA (M78 family)
MNDKAAEAQKKRVDKYLKKWREAGFGWWKIDVTWSRGDHEDEAPATCYCQWEYRQAEITFYLPAIAKLTDEEVEGVVVHELSHLLVASVENYDDDNTRQKTEYAVSCVATALLWTNQNVK